MLLSDLIYQTIKGCVWYNREISKETLINGNTYQGDIDIGVFVNNIFVAFNDGFSIAYEQNKLSPVSLTFKKDEPLECELNDEVLNVYQEVKKNYYNLDFTTTNLNEIQLLEEKKDSEGDIFVEVIKSLPYLEWSIFSTSGDFDLMEYGISNQVCYAISDYVKAKLYYDVDANVSYLKENVALSRLNSLPDFGNKVIHNQRDVDLWEGI